MLSPVQRIMIVPLCRGEPVPTECLVTAVYTGCRGDGPANAEHAIRAQIYKLREKLSPLGITIETIGYGRGAIGYRVLPEHRQALTALLARFGDAMVM